LTANTWASGNRLPACFTPWFGSRPSGMPRARGRDPVRGGCGVGEWRSVFGGIRTESVNPWNPVPNLRFQQQQQIENDPTGNFVHVHFDSVNPESAT
jgi:hypothetical protein